MANIPRATYPALLLILGLILGASAAVFVAGRSQVSSETTGTTVIAFEQRLAMLEKKTDVFADSLDRFLEASSKDTQSTSDEDPRISSMQEDIQALIKMQSQSQVGKNEQPSNLNPPQASLNSLESMKEEVANINAVIDESFQNEGIDETWSMNATTDLGEIFAKPVLENGQITDIDCRTTICRANIAQPQKMTLDEEANFENHLLMELTTKFRGGVNLRRERDANGETKMVVFMVREGYKMPLPQGNTVISGATSK